MQNYASVITGQKCLLTYSFMYSLSNKEESETTEYLISVNLTETANSLAKAL